MKLEATIEEADRNRATSTEPTEYKMIVIAKGTHIEIEKLKKYIFEEGKF